MKGIGIGNKSLQHNIADLFLGIPPDLDRWSPHGGWTDTDTHTDTDTDIHSHTDKHTHTHTHTHTPKGP